MFRGSVKSTGYALHSPVSTSLPLPCVTVCHQISSGLYDSFLKRVESLRLSWCTINSSRCSTQRPQTPRLSLLFQYRKANLVLKTQGKREATNFDISLCRCAVRGLPAVCHHGLRDSKSYSKWMGPTRCVASNLFVSLLYGALGEMFRQWTVRKLSCRSAEKPDTWAINWLYEETSSCAASYCWNNQGFPRVSSKVRCS